MSLLGNSFLKCLLLILHVGVLLAVVVLNKSTRELVCQS